MEMSKSRNLKSQQNCIQKGALALEISYNGESQSLFQRQFRAHSTSPSSGTTTVKTQVQVHAEHPSGRGLRVAWPAQHRGAAL